MRALLVNKVCDLRQPTLIDSLRQSAKQLSAWELGVICGGFHSDMQVHPSCRPSRCPYCHQDEFPGTMHILWSCPCWAHLRVCAQPQNPFLARMGWDQNGINQKLIQQFGAIRREHASAKRLLLLAPKPGGSPGGGGCLSLRTACWVFALPLLSYGAAPMMMMPLEGHYRRNLVCNINMSG